MDDNMTKFEDDAPSTIKEVGIHLAYLRRDMGILIQKVEELPNGFATKEELLSVENRVKKLEDNHGSWWARFGIPIISGVVGAVLITLILSFLDRLK